MIVLDLSASVENTTLDRTYTGLSQFAATNGRFGLVVFSDRAYEALPPNTPARELKPIARFFNALLPTTPRRNRGEGNGRGGDFNGRGGQFNQGPTQFSVAPGYARNPWACCFSFGTEISSGLVLARSIILASRAKRSVWLISDLADDPADKTLVTQAAKSYTSDRIALHVIALAPVKADEQFFDRLLGARGTLIDAKPSSQVRLSSKHGFPTGLAAAAAMLALLLAANEIWSTPLRWGPARASGSVVSG
jgi:hypothetical protein